MADVYIVTFSVIGILISFPGLVVALNLLLPRTVERAYIRLNRTPVKSFILGALVTLVIGVWVAALAGAPSGALKGIAAVSAVIGLGLSSIGVAGLARLLGERISFLGETRSELVNLVGGAVIYELACLAPPVGWFLFLPLSVVTTVGAAVFALLRWVPRQKQEEQDTAPHLAAAPQTDYVEWS